MADYKGITFAKGYNSSFADFKNEFSSTHIFKSLQPKDRERELKKAYAIATRGNTKENGNAIRPTGKSKKNRQQNDK